MTKNRILILGTSPKCREWFTWYPRWSASDTQLPESEKWASDQSFPDQRVIVAGIQVVSQWVYTVREVKATPCDGNSPHRICRSSQEANRLYASYPLVIPPEGTDYPTSKSAAPERADSVRATLPRAAAVKISGDDSAFPYQFSPLLPECPLFPTRWINHVLILELLVLECDFYIYISHHIWSHPFVRPFDHFCLDSLIRSKYEKWFSLFYSPQTDPERAKL